MIAYLSGKIIAKKEKFIILETNNIGYKVFISQKAIFNLKANQELKLFTFLNVKENGLELYGFITSEEFEFFEILEQIRGIGPKVALEISSIGPLDKIRQRILSHDEKLFDGIPGIGKKRRVAIMMELTGKIESPLKKGSEDEAESALIGLGFTKMQAREALRNVPKDISNIEERIKYALKNV
jgi:Holliday junction DNA helicase RuvA